MRIIFMGTPQFALPSLNMIVKAHKVLCVVTQPDKPKGRGMKVSAPPVKFAAEQLGIPVLQPEKISEIAGRLIELKPDLAVVVACGHILTKEILGIPGKGCVNLHASLLPELRGPEPIAWSVIRGLKKTGLTTMRMDEGIDTGDIILQKEMEILPDDTKGSLEQKMSIEGAQLLCKTLKKFEAGSVPSKKQGSNFSIAPVIKKQDCRIDWSKTAQEIHNFIRGLDPEPSAFTFLEGKRLKILKSNPSSPLACSSKLEERSRAGEVRRTPHESSDSIGDRGEGGAGRAGSIVDIKSDEILVSTGRGILSILELQPEGKRVMTAKEYLAGHALKKGLLFE